MIEEFQKLRREIRADFELMSGRQNDMAKRLDEQGQSVAESLATVAQQMNDLGQSIKKVYGELSETTRWVEGRLRLTNDRFDAVLGAVEMALQVQKP